MNPQPRPIRFRAWDKELKRWEYFDFPQDFRGMTTNQDEELLDDYEKWCQFTGLLDKNGREIYEGDILLNTAHEKKATVIWENGMFYWQPIREGVELKPLWRMLGTGSFPNQVEVIGNVHSI